MPSFFPRLPQDKLVTLAKCAGGVALLVLFAVYINEAGLLPTQIAAATTASQTFGNSTLTISTNSGTISPGSSATVSWTATNITDLPASISCFGSGGANCTTPLQTIAQPSGNIAYTSYFSVGGNTYVVVGLSNTTASTYKTVLYQWNPSLNCFGNTSACGTSSTVFQTLSTSGAAVSVELFTVGANTYVAVLYPNSTDVDVYAWMPVGTPSSNTTGCLGNGATCGTALGTTISASSLMDMDVFTIGSDTYLAIANNVQSSASNSKIFKWIASKQCFGDAASTCGSAFQGITSELLTGSRTFTYGSNTYLLNAAIPSFQTTAVGCDTSLSYRQCVYKWMPAGVPTTAANPNGCFGNGSVCGTVLWKGQNVVGGVGLSTAQAGNDALIEAFNSNTNLYAFEKWMPAGTPSSNTTGCLGNGTTCDAAFYTTSSTAGSSISSLLIGSNTYIAFGYEGSGSPFPTKLYLYQWMPAGTPSSNTTGCIGNGTTCNTAIWSYALANKTKMYGGDVLFNINSIPYMVAGSYFTSGSNYVFAGVTNGTTPACSVQVTDPSNNTTTLATADSNAGLSTGTLNQAGAYTYTLTCAGVGNVSTILYVLNPPTVGITAPATVTYGSTATVQATFTPASGDSLTQTAIDGPALSPVPQGYNWTLAPGMSWTPPNNQTYTFDPKASGLNAGSAYVFIPDVSSTAYPGWNHSNNQSATINVVCSTGYAGTTCNQCASGYAFDNTAQCEPFSCFNSGACSCNAGYMWNGTQCVVAAPSSPSIMSFTASRVRKGDAPTLSWNVNGMTSGMSCTITPAPPSGQPIWPGTSSWIGSVQGTAINAATMFTLKCGSAASGYSTVSITAQLLPVYQEI